MQLLNQFHGMTGLKIHLHCGQDYWPGYVNIDQDPLAKADVQMEIGQLVAAFDPGSLSEIAIYHTINSLSLWDARSFFRICHRLLAPQGTLVVETVDLERAVDKMTAGIGNLPEYLEGVRALHGFGRDHMEARATFVPNKFSWSYWHLAAELKDAGYGDVRKYPALSHAPWRDMRVEARPTAQAAEVTPGKRVLFLLYYPMGSITMHIRGTLYGDYLTAHGWQVTYLDVERCAEDAIIQAAARHDLVYSLKVPFLNLYLRLRAETRAKIIFDLTDALWLPHHRNTGWKDLESILAVSHGVFSDNEFVADYGRQFNAYVRVIFACAQVEKFEARQQSRPPRVDGKVRIGWVGTHGTLRAIEVVAPALRALCARHPEVELRLLCLSYQQARSPDLRDVPHSVVPHYDEDTMIDEVLDLDIGIFPPPFGLDDFAIRGPLKALLYMSGGRACVAQRGGDCALLIEDGVTGMLADSLQEWVDKLETLVSSPSLRQVMGKAAQNFVRGRNSLAAVSASLEANLEFIRDHAEPNPSLTFPTTVR